MYHALHRLLHTLISPSIEQSSRMLQSLSTEVRRHDDGTFKDGASSRSKSQYCAATHTNDRSHRHSADPVSYRSRTPESTSNRPQLYERSTTFVNLTQQDGWKISKAVAPSGSRRLHSRLQRGNVRKQRLFTSSAVKAIRRLTDDTIHELYAVCEAIEAELE